MPNTANASDVRNLVNKSGIKADEIKWSGINEFLSNKLKVSKAELLDFLRMNELQIEEVIKRKKWQARLTGPRVEYFDTKEAAQRAIDAENEWIENESVYVDANEGRDYCCIRP